MTNIEKAAEFMATLLKDGNYAYEDAPNPHWLMEQLADAGLLKPEMKQQWGTRTLPPAGLPGLDEKWFDTLEEAQEARSRLYSYRKYNGIKGYVVEPIFTRWVTEPEEI